MAEYQHQYQASSHRRSHSIIMSSRAYKDSSENLACCVATVSHLHFRENANFFLKHKCRGQFWTTVNITEHYFRKKTTALFFLSLSGQWRASSR